MNKREKQLLKQLKYLQKRYIEINKCESEFKHRWLNEVFDRILYTSDRFLRKDNERRYYR